MRAGPTLAQSIEFGDVFQLETILGENYWHGYVKVDFLDPWDGVNPESYMAIDFIELSVNKDSLGGFGVNPEDRRFEEIRIGDIDGFGWGDGAALATHDPAVASANDDLVNLPAKLPVNRDGFGLLASGDLLPDIDADGKVEKSATGLEPGDDWDRRTGEELAGTSYTGSGFTRSAESSFQLGAQYTDLTLSKSYTASSGEADPVLTGDLERVYGAYPAADGNSNVGSNLPGQNNNHPFYFNFYVDPFAIDPAKPLYLTMTHGDLDTTKIEVEVRDIRANSATATLMAAGTTDDGAIESSFVVLDETTLQFDDIFTWDAARNKWHGYLEVRFKNIDTATDEYFVIDFIELSTSTKNLDVPGAGPTLRVPEDYATIQAAINVALHGSTVLVAPGLYRENLDMLGKNIVLRSHDPLDPAVVATTIIDGDVDDDGTGDGAVITFQGTEDHTAAVRGFTIQNGKANYGGGISGYGTGASIEYNVLRDNSAPYGGGIALCRGMVRRNEIHENETYVNAIIDATTPIDPTGVGGGVYNCKNILQNSIYDNVAAIGGGGVWESGALGTATLTNNLIHHNEVTDTTLPDAPGAGVHIAERATQPFLIHNTVVDNTWDGVVVNAIDESETARLFNNILWDTSSPAPTAPDTDWDRLQNSDLRFNVVGGAPAKGSDPMWNMGNSPVFTNAGSLNYTLQSTSPAVDSGIEFLPPFLLDIAGNPRAAATPDIGAYESIYSAPSQGYVSISFPGTITEGAPLTLNARLSSTLQALVTGGATPTWQWRFNGTDIGGATEDNYTINLVGVENAGDYVVTATISGNTYVSGPSTLTIETPQLPDPDPATLPETDGLTMLPGHVFFNYVPQDGSAERAVQVVNTSTAVQAGTATVTEGPFQLAYSPVPWIYNLDPGDSVTFYLRAVPSGIGEFVGRLSFSTGEELTMSCYTETQNQDGAQLRVAPSPMQFGYVAPSSSKDLTATLTNVGTSHLEGSTIATAPFAIVGNSNYNIAPGATETVTIRFSPSTADNYDSRVVFTGGILGETVRVFGSSVSGSTVITTGIRINEVAPWNTVGVLVADGLYPDWIELYNENAEDIDLAGWTLTDDPTNSTPYPPLPAGTVIRGGGYLIVLAVTNSSSAMGQPNCGFELTETTGGHVALYDPLGNQVSASDYSVMENEDWSWAYFEISGGLKTGGSGSSTPVKPATPGDPNLKTLGRAFVSHFIDNNFKEMMTMPSASGFLKQHGYSVDALENPTGLTYLKQFADHNYDIFVVLTHGDAYKSNADDCINQNLAAEDDGTFFSECTRFCDPKGDPPYFPYKDPITGDTDPASLPETSEGIFAALPDSVKPGEDIAKTYVPISSERKLKGVLAGKSFKFVFLNMCSGANLGYNKTEGDPPVVEQRSLWQDTFNAEAQFGWINPVLHRHAKEFEKEFWENVATGKTLIQAADSAQLASLSEEMEHRYTVRLYDPKKRFLGGYYHIFGNKEMVLPVVAAE